MPSPNTNILKKYINQYREITEFHNTYAIRDIDEYLQNCDDILALDGYNDSIVSELDNIDKFSSNLNLALDTLGLIDEDRYRSMLDEVNEIRDQYSDQISSMQPYIDQWNNGC